MKGYKGMTKDMTCREMKYEVGKTYYVDRDIKLCKNGLHFCQNLKDVFDFYHKDNSNRFFEVDAKEPVLTATSGTKSATATLTIVRELTAAEVNMSFYGYGDGIGYDCRNSDSYGNGCGYGYIGNGHGYGDGGNTGDGDGNGCGNGRGYGYGAGYSYSCRTSDVMLIANG